MEYSIAAVDLGGSLPAPHVRWPAAVARAIRTSWVAYECVREIRGARERPDATQSAARFVEACSRLGRSMRLDLRVHGRIPEGPCLIAANHVSYLDPLAIGQTRPIGAIAKSEIMRWPGVGEAAANLGVVFVERGCARSGAIALRKATRLLDAGISVLVFPEGTTTTGQDVLPFSRGAFGIARRMRIPVVPATLRYDSREVCWVGDDSLVPHAVRLHRFNEIGADLIYGPSLQPMAFENAAALAEATRQCVRSLLLP